MTEIKKAIRTETTRACEIKITGRELIELVQAQLRSTPIPHDATVTVSVPGGGDWSNTDLDVKDMGIPIVISWSAREVKSE